MVGDHLRLDLRVQPPVHTADPLHQPDGIPVQVIVDQPGGVLKVQTFGEHVGGNQDAGFLVHAVKELSLGGPVVVGGEPADDLAAVSACWRYPPRPRPSIPASSNCFLQVAGRGHELGEDQDLLPLQSPGLS